MMAILSKEYEAAEKELKVLAGILGATVDQAKNIDRSLNEIAGDDEAGLIVVKLGKIMDRFANDMSDI